ncbi:MAG TPA: RNA-binding cell elongation regulator Jag/EloR [Actinomycetota bacterium]|jgi:spoIIIJ-associated protein
MAEVEKSAPTVEEAIEAALTELGVSEQEARIEVVQEPRSGIVGIGAQPAVVRVRSAAPAGAADDIDVGEQADVAAEFLEGLLEEMGVAADVEINDTGGSTYVEIWGGEDPEGMGRLIGRRGLTLEALQDIVRSAVQQRTGERCLVLVDVEDYRKRRRSQVEHQAQDVGRRVKKTGRPETLPPMGAYERKVVHDAIAGVGGLETSSEGEEPNRRVVVRRSG